MARQNYSKKNSKTVLYVIIGIFILFILGDLIKLILDNVIFLLLIGLIIVLISAIKRILDYRKLMVEVKKYESTAFYKNTSLPYKVVYSNDGLRFEMEVFNRLVKVFPNSVVLTHLLIPRSDRLTSILRLI